MCGGRRCGAEAGVHRPRTCTVSSPVAAEDSALDWARASPGVTEAAGARRTHRTHEEGTNERVCIGADRLLARRDVFFIYKVQTLL